MNNDLILNYIDNKVYRQQNSWICTKKICI